MERLAQVVVGTEAQARHAVPRCTGGGQHEDHGGPVSLGDHAAHDIAGETGEVPVQDHDVVVVDVDLGGGIEPVISHVRRYALVAEPFGYVVGQAPHVFDD